MPENIFYALDFDGVLCDSAIETGLTGWQAAASLWQDMPKTAPEAVINGFRQVRPIIETGYEAILTVRQLFLGASPESLYEHPADGFRQLMQSSGTHPEQLKALFGQTRDTWIANDLPGWVAVNPLYEGIAAQLRRLSGQYPCYIVTTKQERFVKQILAANHVEWPDDAIYGLDRQMGKAEVLQQLLALHHGSQGLFLEDRLQTLQAVGQIEGLKPITLLLALWGYNTETDKALARQQGLPCLTLNDFLQFGCHAAD